MADSNQDDRDLRRKKAKVTSRSAPPEVYAIVIECKDEPQQRELFERLKAWGVKVKLLVL
jgi:hypothetical protein